MGFRGRISVEIIPVCTTESRLKRTASATRRTLAGDVQVMGTGATPSPHEPARDVARAIAMAASYRLSCKGRKKLKLLFAHFKRILKLDRLRLRGTHTAAYEFLLAATAQNLRRGLGT